MDRLGTPTLDSFLRFQRNILEEFWARLVEEIGIEWAEPYQQVLDVSRGVEWAQWFIGGKTEHRGQLSRPASSRHPSRHHC